MDNLTVKGTPGQLGSQRNEVLAVGNCLDEKNNYQDQYILLV